MGEKQIAVVTGATRGIGRNTALFFADKGFTVIATGRNEEKLAQLKEELHQHSSGHQVLKMDVTKPEEVDQAVRQIRQNEGRIDVWINNAGAFQAIGPTWEVKKEDWVNDVTTNLFGPFYSVQAVVPLMLEQGSGTVINLVGGGTVDTFKYGNGYGTSKTAVARFTENLAAELEGTPVKVFALDPGLNDTDMTRYQRNTKIGQQYLAGIEELFEKDVDVPADQAPEWAYYLASGELDAYRGRVVSVYEDLQALKQLAEKQSGETDYHQLRLKK